ncbi:hypothetical protein BDY19DRAFT_916738 [Irpex rosettiformis]|uniref:Uncharacterized protein n=1 Tax=Irpex rosettiformis TaxID=378272 RepID=A0ACB8UNH5_9APHY|nr:hypothetical protein BDY19DRAFT_916738 [Irpex rosettiformis]
MTRRKKIFYLLYVAVVEFCMIIAVFANAYIGQLMWIDHRDAPGGPFEYFISKSTFWTNVWGSAADIFANIIGDGFLLYRCYVIWHQSWWIMAFPALVYAASVVLSILSLVESALPENNSFFNFAHVSFTVPWIALSSALNIILTMMISFRILRFRRELQFALNRDPHLLAQHSQYLNTYTSIVAILVESALPFSIIGLITCILVGKGNSVNAAFLELWGVFPGISPLLIVLRIAMGSAWTNETSELPTRTLTFASRATALGSDSEPTDVITYSRPDDTAHPSETTFVTQGYDAKDRRNDEKV